MKIDAMILREDFYKINEATLETYFREVKKKQVSVKTQRWGGRNCMVVYSHLGVITTRRPGWKSLKFLLDEYNLRNRALKNIFAKMYVCACIFSLGLMSQSAVSLSDKEEISSTVLIFPANRKLRIYNFEAGYVDAIVKDAFTLKYFRTELSYRLHAEFDFVPRIIDYGENWYREQILPGQPLARIRKESLYQKCLTDVVENMGKLVQSSTIKHLEAKEYAGGLYAEIHSQLELAKERKGIRSYSIVSRIAEIAFRQASQLNKKVPVAPSHGDLQSGNVWVDTTAEKTYIIDWETYGWRSVWYDCATILLSILRAGKLKEMMEKRETDAVREALFRNDAVKEYRMNSVMGILVLEDILFYLEDMLELPESWGADIFDRIAGELELMGWSEIDE